MTDTMTAEAATALRKPFPPESIGKLPKGGAMLDYVGHAAVTDRLLTVDPHWTWEPFALTPAGLPAPDHEGNLWIKLTICGVTRIGVGDGKNAKERIGDAIRNAAMRFGVALDLWAKENLVEFAMTAATHQRRPEPAPEPAEEPSSVGAPTDTGLMLDTKSKLAKAMYASINEAGIPKDEVPGLYAAVTGREITSSKELTEDEARAVLRSLDDRKPAEVAS